MGITVLGVVIALVASAAMTFLIAPMVALALDAVYGGDLERGALVPIYVVVFVVILLVFARWVVDDVSKHWRERRDRRRGAP